MKFKVGDRVKIVAYDEPEFLGLEGLVSRVRLDSNTWPYDITFEFDGETDNWLMAEYELEAVPETN